MLESMFDSLILARRMLFDCWLFTLFKLNFFGGSANKSGEAEKLYYPPTPCSTTPFEDVQGLPTTPEVLFAYPISPVVVFCPYSFLGAPVGDAKWESEFLFIPKLLLMYCWCWLSAKGEPIVYRLFSPVMPAPIPEDWWSMLLCEASRVSRMSAWE